MKVFGVHEWLMNRNPVVFFAASMDFPLLTSTMAIHFCVLARLRPSRCEMRSPSYSPIFCRVRNVILVNKPRPSIALGLTSIGTGQFLWLSLTDVFGGMELIGTESVWRGL